jgi:tRNA1(Val) A37 N6-methylase TrmN6
MEERRKAVNAALKSGDVPAAVVAAISNPPFATKDKDLRVSPNARLALATDELRCAERRRRTLRLCKAPWRRLAPRMWSARSSRS